MYKWLAHVTGTLVTHLVYQGMQKGSNVGMLLIGC